MIPKLGTGELIVILLIVLVLFGASRLPALGSSIGQALRGLRKGLGGDNAPAPAPGTAGADAVVAASSSATPARKGPDG
jgi:sec-independent protein translocase protein TatA